SGREATNAAAGGGPADGSMYYDTSSKEFRGRINGSWQPLAANGGANFGGMYQWGEAWSGGNPVTYDKNDSSTWRCESPNPLTGDCGCPSGFVDSDLGRTVEGGAIAGEWDDNHFCYKK